MPIPNDRKKMMMFSSLEIKEFVDKYVALEAEERAASLSVVMEEYILSGIARSFPDTREYIQDIYKKRHQKYVDKFLLLQEGE